MDFLRENKNNIIFILGVILVVAIILVLNIFANSENKKKELAGLLTGKHYVEMKIKDYGTINLELDADTAPITVTNFINLVTDEFYNGLTFHRIIDGFMVQGGDPEGTGLGGSTQTIKGEFLANGVENNISHERGVISMARSDNYNSASSQFFIMHDDDTRLDGNYAAFGKVISGIEVIDKLVKVEVEDDNGTVLTENQPVIEYIKVINNE